MNQISRSCCKNSFSFVLLLFLFTASVKANEPDGLLDRVLSAINQQCQSAQAGTVSETLDGVLRNDREVLVASMAMNRDAKCNCLVNELSLVRSSRVDPLDAGELDGLIRESTATCMIRVSRKHFGAFCRASLLSETDDRAKINVACECMEQVWSTASDEDIYSYSMAAYKRYRNSAGSSVTGGEAQAVEASTTTRQCTDRAGIAANSQYKRDLKVERKDLLARKQAEYLLGAVSAALNLYRLDHRHYPTNAQGLSVLLEESYLQKMPKDAWGNEIGYTLSIDGHHFDVVSFGRDGKPGGSGFDQDVVLGSDKN